MVMAQEMESSLAMLAAALEKEKKGREFYKEAVEKCTNELGKDIFQRLMADEGIHIKRINEIYTDLKGGKSWTSAWKALTVENPELEQLVKKRITTLGPKIGKATGDVEALAIGLEMEQGAVAFYEDHLARATDPVEKEFITCMVAEEQTHYRAIADAKMYLENPESWFTEMEHHVLDGA
jgi:rubrerythrin